MVITFTFLLKEGVLKSSRMKPLGAQFNRFLKPGSAGIDSGQPDKFAQFLLIYS